MTPYKTNPDNPADDLEAVGRAREDLTSVGTDEVAAPTPDAINPHRSSPPDDTDVEGMAGNFKHKQSVLGSEGATQ